MSLSKKIAVTAGTLMLVGSFSASALETIFTQDFESGLGPNESVVTDARDVWCTSSCPFSVQRSGNYVPNFNVHDQGTNPYAGGNGHSGLPGWESQNLMKYSPNMSGQVMGHVYADYDPYEDSYYQIDNISIASGLGNLNLMFDFDSWIESDKPDGFGVAISNDNGSTWDLLTPNASSDMQYRRIGSVGDNSLNVLTGQPTSSGSDIIGFDGFDNGGGMIDMAGTAMFDIAGGYAGDTVSLRFAFASDGDSYRAEGINIDNIKLTGVCTTGQGPNCTPPGGGNSVSAPASLALAALGVVAVRRRRMKH